MKCVVGAAVAGLLLLATWPAPAAAGPEVGWISPRKGYPREKGLGRMVVVTNHRSNTPLSKAVRRLAKHREAKTLHLKKDDVSTIAKGLRKEGPEYVLFAVTPTTVDMNFHLDVLELCRNLDDDPMPDFFFGYLCARNADDLEGFVDAILAREAASEPPVAKDVGMPNARNLQGLDLIMHIGHGTPWSVVNAMKGEEIGALELDRHPVVVSGACFNGVLSRSYHPSSRQRVYLKPKTIEPEKLVSLAWVHAGASAFIAALEGDRGEMAMSEWAHLRQTACPLGEVVGHDYRLAFTSLPADFAGFPRFVPGRRKRMRFYDVMMNGLISRILISDPMLRPVREPMDEPPFRTTRTVAEDGETLTVEIEALRWVQGSFQNLLPKPPSDRFDVRLTVRVELPPEVTKGLTLDTLEVRKGERVIEPTRNHVRHEVWGGRRYVNLQAECPSGSVGKGGTRATWTFAVRR